MKLPEGFSKYSFYSIPHVLHMHLTKLCDSGQWLCITMSGAQKKAGDLIEHRLHIYSDMPKFIPTL